MVNSIWSMCGTCKTEYIGGCVPNPECHVCHERRVHRAYVEGFKATGRKYFSVYDNYVEMRHKEWSLFCNKYMELLGDWYKMSYPGANHLWSGRNVSVHFRLSDNVLTTLSRHSLVREK